MEKLRADASAGSYTLNPDDEFVESLVAGLIENNDRYGIESCPCRLFAGTAEDNTDIICPCVYRDDDLAEHGACFCALYVGPETVSSSQKQVPERRPSLSDRQRKQEKPASSGDVIASLPYSVYRCSVCGYLCAHNNPPHTCPICKAGKERFERFM